MSMLRPVQHLHAVSHDYPGVWRQYDWFRAQRRQLGDWPSWCYCPMAAAHAIVGRGADVPLPSALEISRIAALAAWRPTQGVYRFDSNVLRELVATPITGALPVEHLYRLPEWCVYVELPLEQVGYGFFAHLEIGGDSDRSELRFLLDHERGLLPLALHLDCASLGEALSGFVAHANAHLAQNSPGFRGFGPEVVQQISAEVAGPLLSVLLYLCAGEPELRATRQPGRMPGFPRAKRDRNGRPYMPAAKRPEVYETAFRLGAAIRDAEASPHGGGTVRGHIRRAHWHSYWLGRGEDKRRELRWLHPVAVNLGTDRPTVRHVEEQTHGG